MPEKVTFWSVFIKKIDDNIKKYNITIDWISSIGWVIAAILGFLLWRQKRTFSSTNTITKINHAKSHPKFFAAKRMVTKSTYTWTKRLINKKSNQTELKIQKINRLFKCDRENPDGRPILRRNQMKVENDIQNKRSRNIFN